MGESRFRPDAAKTAKDGSNIPRVRGPRTAKLSVVRSAAGVEVRQVRSVGLVLF